MRIDPAVRFMAKVRQDGDCWIWTASHVHRNPNGYGLFWDAATGTPIVGSSRRQMTLAHVWSHLHHVGPIPPGMRVCHTCDRPPCVNPAHLFLGTDTDNARDSVAKGRRSHLRGERHSTAKLTAAQVAEMRAASTGRYGEVSELARRYCISTANVSKILKRQIWLD